MAGLPRWVRWSLVLGAVVMAVVVGMVIQATLAVSRSMATVSPTLTAQLQDAAARAHVREEEQRALHQQEVQALQMIAEELQRLRAVLERQSQTRDR